MAHLSAVDSTFACKISEQQLSQSVSREQWHDAVVQELQEAVGYLRDNAADTDSSTRTQHEETIREIMCDLTAYCLAQKCPVNLVMSLLQQAKVDQVSSAQDIVVDVLWLFGAVYCHRVDETEDGDTQMEQVDTTSGQSNSCCQSQKGGWTRFGQLARTLQDQEIVQTAKLIERFDLDLLKQSELTDASWFRNKVVRVNTKLFYTQHKYNLLREDSEGYARLLTTLLGCNMATRSPSAIIRRTHSLVGYFKLDPNRVFDLVLEAMEYSIAAGMWSPKARVHKSLVCGTEMEQRTPTVNLNTLRNYATILNEFRATNLKHILGFKFSSCQPKDASVMSVTPYSLCSVAAELVALNLLQVADIWLYLSPESEDSNGGILESLDNQIRSYTVISLTQETKESSSTNGQDAPTDIGMAYGGTFNGHSAALTLAQSTATPEAVFTSKPQDIPLSNDQKVGLVEGLIQFMYGTASKLKELSVCFPFTDVTFGDEEVETLVALFRRSWKALVECCRRIAQERNVHVGMYPTVGFALCRLVDCLIRPTFACIAHGDENESSNYEHVCKVLCCLPPLLRLTGPCLSNDLSTMGMMCSIVRYAWRNRIDESKVDPQGGNSTLADMYTRLQINRRGPLAASFQILLYCLLPSLKLCGSDVNIASQVWDILWQQPWCLRYYAYNFMQQEASENSGLVPFTSDYYYIHEECDPCIVWGWSTSAIDVTNEDPWWSRCDYGHGFDRLLKLTNAKTSWATRNTLKRVASDTIKQAARSIGKISHCNPIPAFDAILNQIEKYDNLIRLVLDAMKFVTPLSLDVVAFLVTQKLASSRAAFQPDGLTPELWLTSLSTFAAQFFQRYHVCSLDALFSMFIHRLVKREMHPIAPVKEILERVGGIRFSIDISDEEVEGQAGSNALRAITTMVDVNELPSDACTKSLVRSLLAGDTQLDGALQSGNRTRPFMPFYLLLVGLRNESVYGEGADSHVKVMGNNFDSVQTALMQYCELLARYAPVRQLMALLPPVGELIQEWHLPPSLAFSLARPVIRASMFSEVPGRPLNGQFTAEEAEQLHIGIDATSTWDGFSAEFSEHIRAALQDQKVHVGSASPNIWDCISPKLFSIFWSLSLFDVLVPTPRYTASTESVKRQIEELGKQGSARNRKERDAQDVQSKFLKDVHARLEQDLPNHKEHIRKVRTKLTEVKDELVDYEQRHKIITAFMQVCVFPRAMLSPTDALYSSTFLVLLHDLSTPSYSSIQALNKAFSLMTPTIASASEREAVNLGIFLRDLLLRVNVWRDRVDVYEKQAAKVGFASLVDGTNDENAQRFDHSSFCKAHNKWHKMLTKVFVASIKTGEYSDIKNAILVLQRIKSVFPVYPGVDRLLQAVEYLKDHEERKDLQTLARGYHTTLKKRMQEKQLFSENQRGSGGSLSASSPSFVPSHTGTGGVADNTGTTGQTDTENNDHSTLGNQNKRRRIEEDADASHPGNGKSNTNGEKSEGKGEGAEQPQRSSRSRDRSSHHRNSRDRRDGSEARRSSSRPARSHERAASHSRSSSRYSTSSGYRGSRGHGRSRR
eukprot:gb/GECG01011080.1/.p1 GENE.gb/GECG01011080.1/~~gb/GECG01011080.1/.p1  ORF type:complete len:1557 (+),score=171.91 gb/GECG01011080.1/:1-4671(+)